MENKITVIPNGPLMVEGNFKIKNVDGTYLKQTEKNYLCRCGKSNKKPFCDGAHKKQ